MEVPPVPPPASWNWFSWKKDATVRLCLLNSGSPACALGFWSVAAVVKSHVPLMSSEVPFAITSDLWTHQWTDLFHLEAKLFSVLLLVRLDPPLHLWRAVMLSVGSERRLSRRHFINQAAEAPPVSAHPIMLAADHLGSWNHSSVMAHFWNQQSVTPHLCYIHTHVSQRAHPAVHQVPLLQSDSQAQVRDADVSFPEKKTGSKTNHKPVR